jgi:single-strand DNA-binding protein
MINVNFMGRLGADAELKTSKGGKQFVSMRIATDEFKNGERGTAWINVSYYAEKGTKMLEFLKKGSAVSVLGVETVGTYQSKNGETMVSRDVLADRIEFVNLGKSGESQSNDSAATDTGTFKPTANGEEVAAASAAATTSDDDLPF